MRLAIVATHPVQYNSPWFRLLAEAYGVKVHVFYTWHGGDRLVLDPGFNQQITWDIPLTDGYSSEVVAPSQPVERRTFWNMNSPSLCSRIRCFDPQAILVIGWNYLSHLKAMRYFHGRIPVLFRGDSTLMNNRGGLRQRLRSIVLRSVYRYVDYALSVGANNTDYFLYHGLRSDQIVLVPHAIDNQRFSADDESLNVQAAELRREFGFQDDQTVLLFVGKFEPVKSIDRLIRCYHLALKQRPDLRLLLVGSGPLESVLRQQTVNIPGVAFLPFQNQTRIPLIYRVGDVTVLPSSCETWGLCLNESMACGRAVLASTKAGACRDLVREGVTGFSFAPDDESLTKAIVDLPNRDKILKMGVGCQSFVKEWSFDVICRRITDLLQTSRQVDREPNRWARGWFA